MQISSFFAFEFCIDNFIWVAREEKQLLGLPEDGQIETRSALIWRPGMGLAVTIQF
ncbi:MAG: hypothetical protein OEZ13_11480 [Spirochaetia bacterium]|nr:hypothetical protein [Spirochaetia bacterium]